MERVMVFQVVKKKGNERGNEVFTLAEGAVTIDYPANLSDDSLKDLQQYLEIFVRKAQRLNSVYDPHDVVHNPDKPF